jgi:glycosyltransferase involved in cell wall biosynthesis
VPPGDDGALARAVAGLLANPGQRRRLGRAARRTVEGRFGLARAVAATAALFEEVRQEQHARRGTGCAPGVE